MCPHNPAEFACQVGSHPSIICNVGKLVSHHLLPMFLFSYPNVPSYCLLLLATKRKLSVSELHGYR